MIPAVLTQKVWDHASAYFRDYVTCPRSAAEVAAYEEADRAGVARPIVFDAAVAELAFDAALAEEAAVAAEASGSSAAGGAEDSLLSDNVAEGSQPDVADVPLPDSSSSSATPAAEGVSLSDKWKRCDDSSVREISLKTVLGDRDSPYLLFYRLVNKRRGTERA